MKPKRATGLFVIVLGIALSLGLFGRGQNGVNASGEMQQSGQTRDFLLQYPVYYPTGTGNQAVGIGDFNNDGLQDATICGLVGATGLHVFLQTLDGHLAEPPTIYPMQNRCYSLAVGDVNNDQRDDILVSQYNTATVDVFLQQSDGTLAPYIPVAADHSLYLLVIADLNNDGRNDVASTKYGGELAIFLQQPSGTLAPPVVYPAPTNNSWVDIDSGDFNNDGLIDLALIRDGLEPTLTLYLQTPQGTLSGPVAYNVPGNDTLWGIGAGDLNSDGLDDVAISSAGRLVVYVQNSSGGLAFDASYPAYTNPASIAIGDMDDDSRVDVVVAHGGWPSVTVHRQQTDGRLAPFERYPGTGDSHFLPHAIALGDLDNDGLNDVALASYSSLAVLYSDPYVAFLPVLSR